jgi:hypothetical protein
MDQDKIMCAACLLGLSITLFMLVMALKYM